MENIEMDGYLEESSAAVKVRNARKNYQSNIILSGLNMTVPKGTIYGLLGPSGCGKTTLINCLVGQMKLDSGTIEMKSITKHLDVGYMPQTLSIYESLTAYENISFYGFLIGMSENDIRTRMNELTSWLAIPSTDRVVSKFSGGQQRCVSLAITLLHDPKLLILDEPTVGMDPILSQRIWDCLLQLADSGNKSIIITTHYIQEASRAHKIGFLRGGVLLAEDVPLSLMERCGCETLEETFLKLCTERVEKRIKGDDSATDELGRRQPNTQIKFDHRSSFSLRRLGALMYKDIIHRRRNILFELFISILPLVMLTICNSAVGSKPKDLKIAIVNEESTCTYRSYNHSCFLEVNTTDSLSCMYLDELRSQSYDLVSYGDLDMSLKEIHERKKDAWALLHFSKNFSRKFAHRIHNSMNTLTEKEITDSFFEVWIDYSNQYIGFFIRLDLIRSMLPFLQKAYVNCNLSPKLANALLGVNFQQPIYGSVDNNRFNVNSMMTEISLMSSLFPSLAAALHSQSDRISGRIERMFVAGATVAEILLSVGIVHFVTHVFQTALNLTLMFVILSKPMYGSLIHFAILQLLIGSMSILQGITFSLMTDRTMFLGLLEMNYNMMMCLTTGLIWPMEGTHELMKILNHYFLPLADTVMACSGIALKKYILSDFVVLKGHISIVVWHFIYLLAIVAIIKIKKNLFQGKTVRH